VRRKSSAEDGGPAYLQAVQLATLGKGEVVDAGAKTVQLPVLNALLDV
jgi:hypothetical protein